MDAIGRIWRKATVGCTTPVCGGTVTSSYGSSPNPRCVPLADATSTPSRRVTVVCITNVCVDTAAPNRDGPKCALSKGATSDTMRRGTASCTIPDSVAMVTLSYRFGVSARPRYVPLTGATDDIRQKVTAACTTTVNGGRATSSLAADRHRCIRKRAESSCSRPVFRVTSYAACLTL